MNDLQTDVDEHIRRKFGVEVELRVRFCFLRKMDKKRFCAGFCFFLVVATSVAANFAVVVVVVVVCFLVCGDNESDPVVCGDNESDPVVCGDDESDPVVCGDNESDPVVCGDDGVVVGVAGRAVDCAGNDLDVFFSLRK